MDVQKMQHTHNHSPLGKKRAKNPKRDDNRNKKKSSTHKRWPQKKKMTNPTSKKEATIHKKRTIKKNMNWKKKYCIHFQPNKTLTNFFSFQHSKKVCFIFYVILIENGKRWMKRREDENAMKIRKFENSEIKPNQSVHIRFNAFSSFT